LDDRNASSGTLSTLIKNLRRGRLGALLRRFSRDRRGVGAIEFAIIVPVLLLLYVGAAETTIALSFAKRAGRSAGAIADIVTQQTPSTNKALLATMPAVAAATFSPFGVTGLTLKITGITIDAASKPTVTWSWAQDGSKPYTVGSATTVPTDLTTASSFLVRTELSIPYTLPTYGSGFLPNGTNVITIQRQYFYRQRQGTSIPCTDC
jgi:Flp pilus assembly protein TadG